MSDLTPDEVLRAASDEFRDGRYWTLYDERDDVHVSIHGEDLARQLLECREALRALYEDAAPEFGYHTDDRDGRMVLDEQSVLLAARSCLPETVDAE
ncbi:MAG: hypothetical protein GY720_15820 [bacterium]|nr:hypothetical protein [bacterium]